MKEIDLLPEWYKSNKRRQFSYRTQYVVLGGMLMIMLVWNLVTESSISQVMAELVQAETAKAKVEDALQEYANIESQLALLRKRSDILEKTDSRINIPSVLGEMSYLIDNRIILNKVQFTSERFEKKQKTEPEGAAASAAVIRVSGSGFGKEETKLLGDVRFRIVISGIAPDAGDVALLILRLEESPYFAQVIPSYSRPQKPKSREDGPKKDYRMSEFEISCYLANYREQNPGIAKELPGDGRPG